MLTGLQLLVITIVIIYYQVLCIILLYYSNPQKHNLTQSLIISFIGQYMMTLNLKSNKKNPLKYVFKFLLYFKMYTQPFMLCHGAKVCV